MVVESACCQFRFQCCNTSLFLCPSHIEVTPDGHGYISISIISQKDISPKVEGSYPVVKARELLQMAVQFAFGMTN